jgi:hypothetical protein
MLDTIKEVFDKAETKSDVATVLIFGTAGFVLDAGLNIVGFLEPGLVGVAAASGALGIKKTWESAFAKRRARKEEEEQRKKEITRAESLLELLSQHQHEDLTKRFKEEVEFFKKEIISIDEFRASINEVLKKYRERSTD